MNQWSIRRKRIIFSIVALTLAILVGVPIFFLFYRAPTCSDGRQNSDETGIDCGGGCQLLCTAEIKEPISRWDPRVFETAPGLVSVLAYLENVNATAEVSSAPYSFKLYDAESILITERFGKTFIPKGQTFAIFEPNIEMGERKAVRAIFSFTAPLVWIRDTGEPSDIKIVDKKLSNEKTTPRVEAKVRNDSLDRVKNIDLTAIVYDGGGTAIAASKTYIDELDKGESQTIVFTWPSQFEATARVCQYVSDVMVVIDRSGSMAFLGENPPQPLTDVKNTAVSFVRELDKTDRVGLVTFANTATTVSSLLSSDLSRIGEEINKIEILPTGIQQTNIADSIAKASEELNSPRKREGVPSFIVLLTDGVPTEPKGPPGDKKFPETSALIAGESAKARGIHIFTIGLGKDVNADFLQRLASAPEDSYLAPTAKELTQIYSQIATKICSQKPAVVEIISRIFPYSIK